MLQKKERLSRSAFNRFFSAGKRFHSPSLTLIYHNADTFHASAVIGKKVAKGAVERNKFRRRVYDVLGRLHREHALTGVFICIAKAGAHTCSYDTLKEAINELVHKTEVLR